MNLYGPLLEDTEWGRPAEPYGDIYHGFDNTGYYVGEYVDMKRNLYLEFLGRGLSINRYNLILIVALICLTKSK